MPIIDLIQFRRGIASLWTSVNTLLSAGEPGFETDKYRLKVGNGTQPWNSLLYLAGSGVPAILAGSGISVITGVGSVGSQYYNQPNVPFYIIHNTGVISITGGDGISVSGSGGIYTISNTGVISITGGEGISVSGSGGYYTVINTGVISITGGNGISVTGSDGDYTVINTGVISITGGSGISVTGSDGVYTVINTGVIGISGGNGISVTGSDGVYTVTNIGVISISPGYGIGVSYYDGMYTVTNTGVISISGGNGISVSGSSGLYTIETTGLSVIGHTHTASNITDFNSAVSGLLTNYSINGHTHTASNITDFNNAVSDLLTNYSISGHTHTASSITDFNEAVDDRIGSGLFVAGTGINLIYNDAGNTFTVSVTDLIANPSGNRILTSRDSTTTGIDAESNLTFDGSLLSVSGNLVANTGTLDIIQFNTNNGPVGSQGQMGWNSTEGTVDIALTDSTIMEIGQHRFFRVRNTTGSPLYKGQVVYASGVHPNGIITPNLYIANNTINEIRFIGLIWDTINNNNNGYVIDFGHLRHLDLDGSATNYAVGDETWNDGDILYAHPTVAGKLTNVKPKHAISLAIILDNGNANGQLFVRPTNFSDLSYNHDVNISGVTNGQFLQYDSTTDYWVASSSGNFSTLQVSGINVSVSGHTHTASQITDFNEAVDDRIGSGLFVAGTGINLNYNDAGNSFTVSVSGLVNNPTNNRILTSTGTTTGIDAESDLTFENKTLNIGSSGSAGGAEAIINLYTNDSGDGRPSINFKDNDDNTKLNIYWDDDENISYVHSLNDTLVLSGPTNYIGINNDGTIGIVSSGVTSNNNFGITNQTANTIASFDANKNVTSLATGTYPSLTELSYVKDVTSAIQTQLNAKQNTLTNPVTGTGVASHVAYWNSSSGIVADSGQLYWDATNNRLGIGTASPQQLVHVSGNLTSAGNIMRLQNGNPSQKTYVDFRIGSTGNYEDHFFISRSGNDVFGIDTSNRGLFLGSFTQLATKQFQSYNNANAFLEFQQAASPASSANMRLGFISDANLIFLASYIERMRLTGAGNLGIGTTSPSGQLHVVGTGIFSQRVGINTGSPNAALHVVGNTNISGILTATSGTITTLNTVPTYISPSALSTSQGNWNPGAGDIVRVSASTSGVNISGIVLGSEYTRVVINIGTTHNITLKHQATTATSGNRIITSTGGDHIIPPTGTVTILYDTIDSRWRVL